jgi:hypothetical protein
VRCTANPSEKQTKRANVLLKKHRAQWLGSLENVLTGAKFERGFLVSASLAQNASTSEAVWKTAAANTRLATVASLSQGRGSGEHLMQFLASGALKNLKRCAI